MKDCLSSMAPNAEELLRLALDEVPLPIQAREHLEQCAICQQQLITYKRTNSYLLSRFYRSQCPDVEPLNLYCADMLDDDEYLSITYHVAVCPLCAADVVAIRRVLADFEPFPVAERPSSLVKRIIATLVPWQPQLVTRGGSSGETSWPRQYRAGEINISLHLSRSSNGEGMLLGLFSSNDPTGTVEELEGIPVDLYLAATFSASQGELSQAHQPFLSTQVDDLSNIVFKAVPVGEYILIVRLPDSELIIDGLTIEYS